MVLIVIHITEMTAACFGESTPLLKIVLPWLLALVCILEHLRRFTEKSRLPILDISIVKTQVVLKDASYFCPFLHCKKGKMAQTS